MSHTRVILNTHTYIYIHIHIIQYIIYIYIIAIEIRDIIAKAARASERGEEFAPRRKDHRGLTAKNGHLQIKEFRSTAITTYISMYIYIYIVVQ